MPIFDQRQAARARATAQLRQGQQQLAAREAEVRSEVRSVSQRMRAARVTAESYRDMILPLRTQIIELEQQQYNYMLRGVYELLLAKQNEITARREYIEAVRDYWIAWVALERAVGGRLVAGSPHASASVTPPASSSTQPMQDHQHGGHP